ncbi:MAG: hypothetical protein ACM3U2_23505 [Deltaproteobacteria bacterium]
MGCGNDITEKYEALVGPIGGYPMTQGARARVLAEVQASAGGTGRTDGHAINVA